MNKSYSKINLFIRSLIFSIYSLLTMMIYSFVCLLSLLLPFRFRHLLIRVYLHVYFYVLKKVCLIDYKIEGLENIPKDRTGIIMSKHQSTWETFFLPLIFHEPAIIIKRELLWLPFFGWGLAIADPISINRKNKTSAMQQIIEKGRKCLDDGRWILVFPEGTRVPIGSIGHYKLGGARLAQASKRPILPIAHNAGRFWPRRKFLKYPGIVQVIIGPLIEPDNKSAEELLRETKSWIEDTMKKL